MLLDPSLLFVVIVRFVRFPCQVLTTLIFHALKSSNVAIHVYCTSVPLIGFPYRYAMDQVGKMLQAAAFHVMKDECCSLECPFVLLEECSRFYLVACLLPFSCLSDL